MKIYFAGSITGGRDDAELYAQIITELQKYGEVLTEHLGLSTLTAYGEDKPLQEIYARDVAWVREADVIVAEVTQPSLGVGYELGLAESLGKRVLCLRRPVDGRRLSAMIAGNAYFTLVGYETFSELQTKLAQVLL